MKHIYYQNGDLKAEFLAVNSVYHRLDGPAYRSWYQNRQLESEGWFINGKLHRENGPARNLWYYNGSFKIKEWRIYNLFHRLDGPAYTEWYIDGQFKKEEWWIDGQIVEMKNHPFVKLLKKYRLFAKWKRKELTSDDWVLIKMSM